MNLPLTKAASYTCDSKSTEASMPHSTCDSDPNTFVIRDHKFLFRTGDRLRGVYRINSGTVKVFRITEDGELQIIGFFMCNDLLGLDALVDGLSRSTAVIMDTANVSLIPFKTIFNKAEDFNPPDFIRKIGESYNRERDHSIVLSQTTNRRVAWFLTEYSDAMVKQGYSPDEFTLPMIRGDIALYLGMAVETLCRILTNMRKKGMLEIYKRNIKLLDIDGLRNIANGDITALLTSANADICQSNQCEAATWSSERFQQRLKIR